MSKRLDKMDEKLDDEDAIRQHRDHERELAKLQGKLARSEQKLRQAEYDLELETARADFREQLGKPGRQPYQFKPKKPSGTATAVLVVNDWHAEETVDPATINGLNEYNLEVADKRIERTWHAAVELIEANRKMSNVQDLVLAVLGDMITGHIHEELAEGNSLSPLEASRWVQKRLRGGIDFLLEHSGCKTITVVTAYGNHGRTTKKPRIATAAKHSYEHAMYWNLSDFYENEPRVAFKIEEGYHTWLDVQGKQVRFHHGDWIKYQGGVGGITIPVNKAINEWNKAKRADFEFFGHWHQHKKDHSWAACNCLIGYNAYALSIKAEYSEPSQTLAIFDRDRPKPVNVLEVFCK